MAKAELLRKAIGGVNIVARFVVDRLQRGDRFATFWHGKVGGIGNPVKVVDEEGNVTNRGEIAGTDVPKGNLVIKDYVSGEKLPKRGSLVRPY